MRRYRISFQSARKSAFCIVKKQEYQSFLKNDYFCNKSSIHILNPKLVISKLVSSELVRNSSKLLGANIFAQAVALMVYPILTRMYSPSDFGLFNLFLSIGGVIVIFTTAEYQNAIVLPKDEKKATSCFHAGFLINIFVSVLCLLSVIFSKQIADVFDAPSLANWYWLMPFYVLSLGTWNLLNYWYTRNKKFNNVSAYQVSQNIISSGSKIGFGALGWLSGGLIISSVLAPIVSIAISLKSAWKKNITPLLVFDKQSVRQTAYEYRNFPKYSLPRAIINNISGNLPILLLSPFFSLTEIGFFGMAFTLAFRPINMVTTSLYQVFFQRTAERVQNGQHIKPFFRKYIRNTLLILIPCFALLYFILPWFASWFLGDAWCETSTYIRMMLPWLLMSCMVAPICFLSDVFQKQRLGLYFEIALFVCRVLGVILGIILQCFSIAIIGYCIFSALVIFAQLLWYKSLISKYEKTIENE